MFKNQKALAKNDQKALAKNEFFSKFKICKFFKGHERDLDTDFLLIILRELLKVRNDLKAPLSSSRCSQFSASGGKHGPP